jgi:NAD(P)-dependent dehydrogenase (short-subunit alcohol dehydrogenase family)
MLSTQENRPRTAVSLHAAYDSPYDPPMDMADKVALITGGSNGIGEGVARHLARQGAHVVLADIDDARGATVAEELGGRFIHTDVSQPADCTAAVAFAVREFGALHVAHLNAGVTSWCGMGDDFDPEAYRRSMSINLDGVVYGIAAARPAIIASGGGTIVATASMAGLVSVPFDPIYSANKHAVVGLVRSIGDLYAAEGVRVHALCPSFAHTNIIKGSEKTLVDMGFPILDVADVVEAFQRIIDADTTGECWYVVAGRPSEPFRFRHAPGPRLD